jgi:hypothetical protein
MNSKLLRGLVLVAGTWLTGSFPAPCANLQDIAVLAGDTSSAVAHSEPSIAVNPLNPQQIAVVAFSGNWGPSSGAPIWKSDDGGNTWRKVLQLPQPAAGQSGPFDQKIAFDRNGKLYVAEVALDSLKKTFDYIYRQNGAPDATMLFGSAYGDDQPHLDIDKVSTSSCADHLYSPWLNTLATRTQANVENSSTFGANVSDVAAGDNSSFSNRTTRIALAPDGKAYIVYKTQEGTVSGNPDFENAHFVVQRSDDCGSTWTALGRGGSSVTGRTNVQTYFTKDFGFGTVKNRARSSDAWIAADPRTGDVYVSYVNRDASGFAQIYVAHSSDNGGRWTTNRVTDGTHNSAFPEIAVTDHGTVGVMYIDVESADATGRYRHHFSRSGDLGASWTDEILQAMDPSGFPNAKNVANCESTNAGCFIWGDYEGLTAAGSSFYGVFTGASIGRTTAQLDPIFFRIDERLNCLEVISSGSTNCTDAGGVDSTCASARCPEGFTLTGGGGACAAGNRKIKSIFPREANGSFVITCEKQGVDAQAVAICCQFVRPPH